MKLQKAKEKNKPQQKKAKQLNDYSLSSLKWELIGVGVTPEQ